MSDLDSRLARRYERDLAYIAGARQSSAQRLREMANQAVRTGKQIRRCTERRERAVQMAQDRQGVLL